MYYYDPEVKLLLMLESDEKVELHYHSDGPNFQMPAIGSRPPYYTNPRYESYYPVI